MADWAASPTFRSHDGEGVSTYEYAHVAIHLNWMIGNVAWNTLRKIPTKTEWLYEVTKV